MQTKSTHYQKRIYIDFAGHQGAAVPEAMHFSREREGNKAWLRPCAKEGARLIVLYYSTSIPTVAVI